MRCRVSGLVVGLAIGALAGCSSRASTTSVPTDYRAVLTELGEALKTTAADRNPPPAKLSEFERVEPMAPTAGPLIRSGEVVYLWGAGYVAGGTKVVAYEKKAAAEGGLVLLQDGSVKQMSADELKAAPKAGTPGPGK